MNHSPAGPSGPISPLPARGGRSASHLSLVAVPALLAWGLFEGWALLRSRLLDRLARH